MINQIVRSSIRHPTVVFLGSALLAVLGVLAVRDMPVDALPDLSDVQVIIKTSYPGQSPQVIEDQITYPLANTMLSVPKAQTVRGYSFLGDSYVYVIFEDGVDPYWARSRVQEYLGQATQRLPVGITPELGPDATGIGWIYQYALADPTGNHDLAELRSIQDWFLRYELQAVPGVAEVATIGGMVKQYQVIVHPNQLQALGLTLGHIRQALLDANQETSGSVVEMGESEYMVRATGYLQSLEDVALTPVGLSPSGTAVLLRDIAQVRLGPTMRRGVAELDGQGEVVGGIIVMRTGENAREVIRGVRKKLEELTPGLPEGVEIIPVYDRSDLINRVIDNLRKKLLMEMLTVLFICALFLFHMRSALILAITLPLGLLASFVIMRVQGINANVMSLGGLAIAIGAMVDAAIVMIENAHRHLEKAQAGARERWEIIARAASEVCPALFCSLLIIALSFLPVFALEAQEGRLFTPLAYTKTYAMVASAILTITLVPVLMGFLIRGRLQARARNPLNRMLGHGYQKVLAGVLKAPYTIILLTVLVVAAGWWPLQKIGSEFMPPLEEGDLFYMPTTHPGISIDKARELLQQTNRLIGTVPEVHRTFGKVGRAETATDPAPLTMIETVVQLHPQEQWRPGMTIEKIRDELQQRLDLPGVANAWVMPIKARVDMLSTGLKTPVGIKVSGPELSTIEQIGQQLEDVLEKVPGTLSAYSERPTRGNYLNIEIDRARAARHGLNIRDIQDIVSTAIGGMTVTYTVEGRERYPVNLRYPQHIRDSLEQIKLLPLLTPLGARIPLSEVADVRIVNGPAIIKSENARLSGWTYIDIDDRDLGSYVADAQQAVAAAVEMPPGYTLQWSGQYEHMLRAEQRLGTLALVVLLIIIALLYVNFRRPAEIGIILATLPIAAIGGLWLMHFLDYRFSVATSVGFIVLAGVAIEIGVVMMLYLNQALQAHRKQAEEDGRMLDRDGLRQAIMAGAGRRLRPILMTVLTVVVGLLPIMLIDGAGSDVMRRIAAPMIGGMISTTVLVLAVIPSLFLLWQTRTLEKRARP